MCPTLPKDTRIIRQNVSKYCCGTWKSRQLLGTHKHYSPLEHVFFRFIFLHNNILWDERSIILVKNIFLWALSCTFYNNQYYRSETNIIEKLKDSIWNCM